MVQFEAARQNNGESCRNLWR